MKRLSLFVGIAAAMFAVVTASTLRAAVLSPAPIGPAVTKNASAVQQIHLRRHRHGHRHYRRYRYGFGYGVPFLFFGHGHHGHHGHHGFGHGGFGHGGHHGHH
jgi:hypothetical protein